MLSPSSMMFAVSGLGSLFRRERCGRGGVIGYSENDENLFGYFGGGCFLLGFFCPSAFGIVDL